MPMRYNLTNWIKLSVQHNFSTNWHRIVRAFWGTVRLVPEKSSFTGFLRLYFLSLFNSKHGKYNFETKHTANNKIWNVKVICRIKIQSQAMSFNTDNSLLEIFRPPVVPFSIRLRGFFLIHRLRMFLRVESMCFMFYWFTLWSKMS